MESSGVEKGGESIKSSSQPFASTGSDTAREKGNVLTKPAASSKEETGAGQQAKPDTASTASALDPLATSFTPRSQAINTAAPTSPSNTVTVRQEAPKPPPTPTSLERFARDLREQQLQSSDLSTQARVARLHDQRRQLLSHMSIAKAEMDELEKEFDRAESFEEGLRDTLSRLEELKKFHEWVGYKWRTLGEEIAELEAELAMPDVGDEEEP